jgi:hypothetical protein
MKEDMDEATKVSRKLFYLTVIGVVLYSLAAYIFVIR